MSGEGKDGGDEGEVLLRRSKRRRHLPKIWTFKKLAQFFLQTDRQTQTNRQTDKQTDRQTDKQTNRPTDRQIDRPRDRHCGS